MNAERFETFSTQYRAQLAMIGAENPDYFKGNRTPSKIADNMLAEIRVNGIRSVTIANSEGFKRTCKTLGIKQTYIAIEKYLNGE